MMGTPQRSSSIYTEPPLAQLIISMLTFMRWMVAAIQPDPAWSLDQLLDRPLQHQVLVPGTRSRSVQLHSQKILNMAWLVQDLAH